MSIYQISVFLENRAGSLSEVTKLLADSGIDLRAVNLAETADYGILRIIADDYEKAEKALKENGFIAKVTKVLAIVVPNKSGGLHMLLDALADEKLDIQYMYSIFNNNDGFACMVIQTKDIALADEAIKKHNIKTASAEELCIK